MFGSLKKNLNVSRLLSEHPPVRGGKVKMFRWDQRLQINTKNLIHVKSAFLLSIVNRVSTKSRLNSVRRLNPLVVFSKNMLYS